MNKFLHTADLHLDSALSSINNSIKAKARRVELVDAFQRMVAFALQNNCQGVVVAGDLFDTKNASLSTKKQVCEVIAGANGLTFFVLPGNHDSKAFDSDFVSMLPQNAIVLQKGKTFVAGNVTITGCDDVESVPTFGEDTFNIVVMHGQVVSGNGEGINIKKLAGKNINYLALGHVHSFAQGKIDRRGKYAYCGCPEGRGFDELDEKGFVVFDTQGGVEFIQNCSRQCHEVFVDITGCDTHITQTQKVEDALANFSRDDMFKVVLTGQMQRGQKVAVETISNKIANKVFFAKVVDQTTIQIDSIRLNDEISLRGEFFRVVESLKLTQNDKNDVLKLGFAAMDGLEVDDD